jgi:serine protease Do
VNPVRFGPFVQHTAAIDHGNSGGPLLVQMSDVVSGYAVAGINSMGWTGRASTFFAIPADRALEYIAEAVKPKDEETMRRNLDMRLDSFIKSLAKPKAVYGAIADYLSNACTASNAEYAIGETFSRAPRTVQDAIDGVSGIVDWMQQCVAWLIEDTFRGKTAGTLRATLGDISQNTDGSYTVPLIFADDRTVTTTWALEFGIWKLDKAGDSVSGDKTLVEKQEKQQRKTVREKKDYDNFFLITASYVDIFDHLVETVPVYNNSYTPTNTPVFDMIPAFDATLFLGLYRYFLVPFSFTITKGFWQVDFGAGFKIPIDIAKAVTLSPYATIGLNVRTPTDTTLFGIDFGLSVKGGLMLTTKWVPGLFALAAYQYNLTFTGLFDVSTPVDAHMFKAGVGYAFKF